MVVVLAGCGGGESTPAGPENQAVCPPGWNTGTFFRTATSAHIAACMEAGESVRARDPEGNTPLHLAGGFSDDPAVIQALISAGASAGATNDLGYTVLCFAVAENENTPVIQALLDGGSQTSDLCRAPGDVNGIYPGVSPLHVAARFNPNPDVAEVLIRAGADVNAEGGIGGTSTPLFFAACCNDNPAMVEFLLRSGAELRWAAQPASRNENPDILRILIAAGAELSGALHRAVFNRTTEVTGDPDRGGRGPEREARTGRNDRPAFGGESRDGESGGARGPATRWRRPERAGRQRHDRAGLGRVFGPDADRGTATRAWGT